MDWSGFQSMWVDFSLPSSGLRSPSAAPIASGEETGVESLTRFSSVQRRRYRQPRVVNPFALIESQCGSDTVIGSVCGCGDSAFANNQKKEKRVAHVVVCCHHLWYRRGQNRCSESAALGWISLSFCRWRFNRVILRSHDSRAWSKCTTQLGEINIGERNCRILYIYTIKKAVSFSG